MKKYEIKIEWEIRDTKNLNSGFKTGTSTLICEAKNKEEVVNQAIFFASHLPSWELSENDIDVEDYREGKICTYYYATQISKVISIKIIK